MQQFCPLEFFPQTLPVKDPICWMLLAFGHGKVFVVPSLLQTIHPDLEVFSEGKPHKFAFNGKLGVLSRSHGNTQEKIK